MPSVPHSIHCGIVWSRIHYTMSRTTRRDFYDHSKPSSFVMNGKLHEITKDPKANRDRKKWYKPGKSFKRPRRSSEKAKVKQAIKHEKEVLPAFKKDDVWSWT